MTDSFIKPTLLDAEIFFHKNKRTMDFSSKQAIIEAIDDEVRILHPLLAHLFRNIARVTNVEYTHGTNEKGADFIVERKDEDLGVSSYIGVVAKKGRILQNFDDVSRQVEECLLPRHVQGGMKTIRLTEVWVLTTGAISRNAQDKISDKYKTQKITFIDGEKLTDLVDRFASYFWYNVPTDVGSYLQDLATRIQRLDTELSVLKGLNCDDFYINPEIQEYSKPLYSRHAKPQKPRLVNFTEIARKESVSFLEGDMGFGKSKTARAISLYYSAPERFKQFGIIPVFLTFRDFCESNLTLAQTFERETKKYFNHSDFPKAEVLFVLDGVDEAIGKSATWQDRLQSAIKESIETSGFHLLLTSRPLRMLDEPVTTQSGARRYVLRPLSLQKLISFVEQACSKLSLPKRIFEDLQKSDLFKQLPQSPIAAALLSRLISQNTNDLPANLTELYSKSIENLLGRWDIEKGGCTEKEYKDAERVTLVLADFIVGNQLPHVNLDEALQMINNWHSERNTAVSLDSLKERVLYKSGIFIVDEDQRLLGFRHRSFGEYLLAQSLVKRNKSVAPSDSFNPYWVYIQFFYTGLLGDCEEHLKSLLSYAPKSEPESWLKIMLLPDYLMAGYQTPYRLVEENLYKIFIEAAQLYSKIRNGDTKTKLVELPEMHLLWFFQKLIRSCFEYEYFRKSISVTLLKIDEEILDHKTKEIALFFAACYAAELGDASGFEFILKHYPTEKLQLSVAFGIRIEQEMNKDFTKLPALKTHEKKLNALFMVGEGRKRLDGLGNTKVLDDLFEKPVKARQSQSKQ